MKYSRERIFGLFRRFGGNHRFIGFIFLLVLAARDVVCQQNLYENYGRVPSLLRTDFTFKTTNMQGLDSVVNKTKFATCFPISLNWGDSSITWCFFSNYHPFFFEDSLKKVLASTEKAITYRNTNDTLIEIALDLFKFDSLLDIAILSPTDDRTFLNYGADPARVVLDLKVKSSKPNYGEKIIYTGFPKILIYPELKRNYPLLIQGYVSQQIDEFDKYIIQAPIFEGASGSPIFSGIDGRFLGIVYGKFRGQESLTLAINAEPIRAWIIEVLPEKYKRRMK